MKPTNLQQKALAFSLLGLVLTSACDRLSGNSEWLVKVGKQTISVEAYRQRLRATHKDLGDIPVLDRQGILMLQRRLLAEMISEQLLLAEADRRSIAISDQEVAVEVENLRMNTSEREWQSYLLEHYVDERSWQVQLRNRLRIERLLQEEVAMHKPVLDQEVAAYANELTNNGDLPDSIELSQIVVGDPKHAEDLRRQIVAGTAFADVAREHSIGLEKNDGGYLGFMRLADLPQSFAPAFELPPDRLSSVVETEFGFHLFWVHSRRQDQAQHQQLDHNRIRQTLLRERSETLRAELLEKLKSKTTIELNQDAWTKLLEE